MLHYLLVLANHNHRREHFGNVLYNTFCTNVVQNGVCPQDGGTSSIVDNSRQMFNSITGSAELINQVKEILHNISSIEISQESAERLITTIVEDVLVKVTRSNIDYFMTEYEDSIEHSTKVITITVVATVLGVGAFCISCLCIVAKYYTRKEALAQQQLL